LSGFELAVPYPSPFSRGGWFFIEFSSLVDEIDADWSFGQRIEKTPNPVPSKTLRGRQPAADVTTARSYLERMNQNTDRAHQQSNEAFAKLA
jgi:hypothetical protein